MKKLNFRIWVHRMWAENNLERLQYRQPFIDLNSYFKEYKYWLKETYTNEKNVKKS